MIAWWWLLVVAGVLVGAGLVFYRWRLNHWWDERDEAVEAWRAAWGKLDGELDVLAGDYATLDQNREALLAERNDLATRMHALEGEHEELLNRYHGRVAVSSQVYMTRELLERAADPSGLESQAKAKLFNDIVTRLTRKVQIVQWIDERQDATVITAKVMLADIIDQEGHDPDAAA